jgi:hypothetical protein
LFLIQLGGIGILTFASFFASFIKKGIGVKHQIAMNELLDSENLSGSSFLLKRILIMTLVLMTNITILPIRGSALVDISYTSASPALSAQISNTWTEQFIVQSMDRRFASTADARKFLEGRLADLRTRLETSERDLVNYAGVSGDLNPIHWDDEIAKQVESERQKWRRIIEASGAKAE